MESADRVRLTLAIDPASEPITGALGDDRGQSLEFSGWLGFAAALEELLSAPAPGPAAPPVRELTLGQS